MSGQHFSYNKHFWELPLGKEIGLGSRNCEAWFYLGAAWSPKIGDQQEGPGGQEFEIHAT